MPKTKEWSESIPVCSTDRCFTIPPEDWASLLTKVTSNTWFSVPPSRLALDQQPGRASLLNIGEAIRTHHIKKLQAETAKRRKAGPEIHLHGGKSTTTRCAEGESGSIPPWSKNPCSFAGWVRDALSTTRGLHSPRSLCRTSENAQDNWCRRRHFARIMRGSRNAPMTSWTALFAICMRPSRPIRPSSRN